MLMGGILEEKKIVRETKRRVKTNETGGKCGNPTGSVFGCFINGNRVKKLRCLK